VDLSALDDVYPSFVSTLARLTTTARAHSCELFLVGLRRPVVLVALDAAPLDELFAVYRAACLHDTGPTSTVPPVPGRSAGSAWMPEPTRMTSRWRPGARLRPPHRGGTWRRNRRSAARSRRPRHRLSDHERGSGNDHRRFSTNEVPIVPPTVAPVRGLSGPAVASSGEP
jgi:hypothetical protein